MFEKLKKVWRYMFKGSSPVVPGGYDLHAEIEKRRVEEGKKLDAMLRDGLWNAVSRMLPLVKAELACPSCSGPLEESAAKPGIYRCRACNQAIIKSHVWDDPNFQAELTHYNKGTVPFERVDGINAHPLAEEYDIDEVMNSF